MNYSQALQKGIPSKISTTPVPIQKEEKKEPIPTKEEKIQEDFKHLVVDCRHSKFDVYIGRPTKNKNIKDIYHGKYGNPFRMESESDRAKVIKDYELWLMSQPKLIQDAKQELKGKTLACWCSPRPCHGDVLARVANS
eukprot:TRINITY_DN6680_c4_g1_i1.p1 TRINITY_DN6680_c4_g1~~TRINITY_DN6680_c4_g1_i1.p1  ORF type:complete len:138 (-),score=36.24 TRINITY_DN6680_c4_g1_i1:260-673(-)